MPRALNYPKDITSLSFILPSLLSIFCKQNRFFCLLYQEKLFTILWCSKETDSDGISEKKKITQNITGVISFKISTAASHHVPQTEGSTQHIGYSTMSVVGRLHLLLTCLCKIIQGISVKAITLFCHRSSTNCEEETDTLRYFAALQGCFFFLLCTYASTCICSYFSQAAAMSVNDVEENPQDSEKKQKTNKTSINLSALSKLCEERYVDEPKDREMNLPQLLSFQLGGKFFANVGIKISFEVQSTRYQCLLIHESLNKEKQGNGFFFLMLCQGTILSSFLRMDET